MRRDLSFEPSPYACSLHTGSSNHNGGLAIDIQDAYSWKTALENNGWEKLGDWDPMHYDYQGASRLAVLVLSACRPFSSRSR